MKISIKTITLLVILLSISLFATIYSGCAYYVASHVYEYDGTLMWATPGYSFFPWPTTPTGITIQVLVPLNEIDMQYYQYIIQLGVLIILTLLSWLIFLWKAIKTIKNQ